RRSLGAPRDARAWYFQAPRGNNTPIQRRFQRPRQEDLPRSRLDAAARISALPRLQTRAARGAVYENEQPITPTSPDSTRPPRDARPGPENIPSTLPRTCHEQA